LSEHSAIPIEKVGVSAGTAAVLGLKNVLLQETPTTGHFLFGDKCSNNCAFCAQASGATTGPHHLSRVTWPEFSWEQIAAPLRSALESGALKRVCVQTVECAGSPAQALEFVRRVRALSSGVLISAAVAPVSVARVGLYFDAGASNIGLPLDAATSGIYAEVKGGLEGTFEHSWDVLESCSAKWPGRISTHLIVGLGETEEEAVRFLVRARDLGVTVGLFAFTPIRGTAMEHRSPPDLASYRRVQMVAHYLKRGGDAAGIEFSAGRIC
jgi:biotin synthase